MVSSFLRRLAVASSRRGWRLKSTAAADETASLDWKNLGFGFHPTKCTVQFSWKDGEWSKEPRLAGHNLELSYWSNVLHYGQALFEGLKAFELKNGDISVFNPKRNYERMSSGARRLMMPEIPEEMFLGAIDECVRQNRDYVPPFDAAGAALYLRPLFIGSGMQVGLGPANEYMFGVGCTPVGAYYKGGLTPINAEIIQDFDRAAPLGVGNVKCAGNYAADILPATLSKKKSFDVCLYLDATTRTHIEEFSTSNFVGISRDKSTYVTPDSSSTLPSITNIMLSQIAKDLGMKVERRQVPVEELEDFCEVFAVGTAVVTSPVKSISYGDKVFNYEGNEVAQRLHDELTGIQRGIKPDKHRWHRIVIPSSER